ncbi:hypothetical protein ACJIZ3_011111 [Penstemon smallii]|uniref:Uncharacterized protein n=1 Tax=Penstemon smallii TaxID=265156 RepID=A0ABD3UI75_9LAMI
MSCFSANSIIAAIIKEGTWTSGTKRHATQLNPSKLAKREGISTPIIKIVKGKEVVSSLKDELQSMLDITEREEGPMKLDLDSILDTTSPAINNLLTTRDIKLMKEFSEYLEPNEV